MIVTTRLGKYHADYLRTLKKISPGAPGEVLNDGHGMRVRINRQGSTVSVVVEGNNRMGEWDMLDSYQAPEGPRYCEPGRSGLNSTPSKVATRLRQLFKSAGLVNRFVCDGKCEGEIDKFFYRLHCKLVADGWRITQREGSEHWQVLPPRDGVRNDDHES